MTMRCIQCLERVEDDPHAEESWYRHVADAAFLVRFIGGFDPNDSFDQGWVPGFYDVDSLFPGGWELCREDQRTF